MTQAGKRYPSFNRKRRDMRARRDAETDTQRASNTGTREPDECDECGLSLDTCRAVPNFSDVNSSTRGGSEASNPQGAAARPHSTTVTNKIALILLRVCRPSTSALLAQNIMQELFPDYDERERSFEAMRDALNSVLEWADPWALPNCERNEASVRQARAALALADSQG